MFNSLKTLKALVTAKPRSARKAKASAQDNLARAQAKIAALKAEIEASQVEARAMAQLQSEEIAKTERLRQTGADLLRIHKDLQTARAKTATAEAGVRAAAAATQAADLELHDILQSLDARAKPPTPVAKPIKLAVPAAPLVPTLVTETKAAPAASLSIEEEVRLQVIARVPEAAPALDLPPSEEFQRLMARAEAAAPLQVALQPDPDINPFTN